MLAVDAAARHQYPLARLVGAVGLDMDRQLLVREPRLRAQHLADGYGVGVDLRGVLGLRALRAADGGTVQLPGTEPDADERRGDQQHEQADHPRGRGRRPVLAGRGPRRAGGPRCRARNRFRDRARGRGPRAPVRAPGRPGGRPPLVVVQRRGGGGRRHPARVRAAGARLTAPRGRAPSRPADGPAADSAAGPGGRRGNRRTRRAFHGTKMRCRRAGSTLKEHADVGSTLGARADLDARRLPHDEYDHVDHVATPPR